MLYLVYAAEDVAESDNQSTNFAYFVHSVSFVLELVTLPEISGQGYSTKEGVEGRDGKMMDHEGMNKDGEHDGPKDGEPSL